tara:strand:+ start:6683 stop:7813 length:1131 start_codon:yes stop_codon:yes gene_type:complete
MYQTFGTRIQDLVGTAVTDPNALTEWLTEEAVNAINIMSPEMLISASSTHRLILPETFNSVGRTLSTSYADDATSLVLDAGSLTSTANCKVGSIICTNQGTTYGSERMRVTAITGSGTKTLTVVRGINGTTAYSMNSGLGINVVHEKPFNTRKFKLLEVNRDGYSARLINSGIGQQAVDQNSIHYATSKSPVYYVRSGNIYIRPMVSESEQGEIVGLTYPVVKQDMKSTTDLPIECEDFIVIGAARKFLIRHMYEEFAQLPAGITKPTVAGATEELTATIEAATAGEATDKYDFSRWFDLVADYIEDDEDIELASAQLQKIGTYIQTHQEELSAKNTVFASALQRATTKYNWFIAQYDKLTLMYNEKAQILRGPQA